MMAARSAEERWARVEGKEINDSEGCFAIFQGNEEISWN